MFDVTRYADVSQRIIDAGRFLYERGWSPATSSNYSERIDAEHVAITVSGRHKGQLTAGDVMVVDLAGQPVQSRCRSSAETLLHTVMYELFPDVGAVLHTHSVNATVIGRLLAGEQSLTFRDYELQKAFTGVMTHEQDIEFPIFENTQDIAALSEQVRAHFRQHPEQPGYLIRGHGLYTWAGTMNDCLRHVEALEFLLACELETMRCRR